VAVDGWGCETPGDHEADCRDNRVAVFRSQTSVEPGRWMCFLERFRSESTVGIVPIVERHGEETMLRVYSGQSKGATSFFRNRPLLRLLLTQLAGYPRHRIKVLFHASSIGAEPYSFAAYCQMYGLTASREIEIFATDIDGGFLDFAREARYPAAVLSTMNGSERDQFENDGGSVRPVEALRKMVTFLPPISFVDATFAEPFDVVCLTNAMTYVSAAEQTRTLALVASYDRGYLVASAFHPDTIEADLQRGGYVPVEDEIEAIHDAWNGRRRDEPVTEDSPQYSWVLPRFSRIDGYAFRYGAVFRKATLPSPWPNT